MRIPLFIALSFFMFNCKTSKVQVDKKCRPMVQSSEIVPPILTTIESVELEGDCLTLNIEAQICDKKTTDFELRWNGKTMKSLPPQVSLSLHMAKSDECDKKQKYQLKYDISQLKSINRNGAVIVRLVGYDERIDYKY